jgi:DNA polymerase-3 subunit gamma/tau
MRQLLDSAQYAPTRGRFKVYVIDEVHQLSGHAFNAMLKTLEEPPEHLKFILATTDPQKIPVTVLSRCLQFNLKQMPRAAIASHLARVLQAEKIAFDPEALALIARAAAGSMRDALSLLDQAIAHGAGRVAGESVRAMLGAIDEGYSVRLVELVARNDGAALMTLADEMQARSLSFDGALQDLCGLLLRISLTQAVPAALDEDQPERERIVELARLLDPETVQLLYQIALQGREDLPLAPDEHSGFVMTLLRMMAFQPDTHEVHAPVAAPVETARSASSSGSGAGFDGNWEALAQQLAVGGAARELVRNAELRRFEDGVLELTVPKSMAHLAGGSYRDKLQAVLEQHFGKPMGVRVTAGEAGGSSVAAREASDKEARRAAAARSMKGDQFVQDLVNLFDARVVEPSVQPAGKNGN